MFMILEKKLTFAFREFFPLYWASIRDYSENDYIIITKGRESVCYYLGNLTAIEKTREKLSRKTFRNKLIIDLKKENKKVENYALKDISKLSLKEILVEFNKFIKLILDWAKVYHLTEEEYWKGLENIVPKKELEQISHLRFESKKISMKSWKYTGRILIPEIIQRTKISYGDCVLYTFDELMNLPKKPSAKVIADRRKGWGIIKKGKIKLMADKELTEYKKLISKEHKLEKKELQGLAVHKGEVIGEVKLVKSKDMNRNKIFDLHNKILVTEMTKPELVPFLQGCLGIITDEGGLLCHASILAREFNLSCIVGTKIATKILKDKQKVKLDANTGTIIIL